jgi:ABC-type branched-subunit amino acid transport system permease subunit
VLAYGAILMVFLLFLPRGILEGIHRLFAGQKRGP